MQYRFADVYLDSASRLVQGPQGPIDVPRRVFDCLAYLLAHRDRAVSRDELILYVWNRPNVSDTQLAQTVLRARRLAHDDGIEQRLIRTVPGFGYHWVGDVEVGESLAPPPVPVTVAEAALPPSALVDAAVEDAPPALMAVPVRPVSRRPLWMLGIASMLVLLLGVWAWTRSTGQATAASSPGRIVVLPVETGAQDDVAWARLGLMDAIATRLRAHGLVVAPSESVIAAIPAGADQSSLQPQGLNAEMLIQARVVRLASGWQVVLDGRRANGVDLHLQQQHPQLLEAAAAASDALLASLGRRVSVEAHPRSEALLRIRAALLGNELDSIRELLARLPVQERESRDTRYLAAELDYRAGRLNESLSALNTLLQEPAVRSDPAFRGRVLVARGSVAMRLRDDVASEQDFNAAITALDGVGADRDLGRALMGRGGIALRAQRFDEAAEDLSRARRLLEDAGDDLGAARAEVNLALLQRQRGRPLEALAQLQAAATRFANYAAINELSAAYIYLVDLQCALLRWNDALATSDRAAALLPRLPDPHLRARLLQTRAATLLGLGRLREADAVLAELAVGRYATSVEDNARSIWLAGQLAYARGEYAAVVDLADRLSPTAQDESREIAVSLHVLALRARRLNGQEPEAAAAAVALDLTDEDSAAQLLRGLQLQQRHQLAAAEDALRLAARQAATKHDAADERLAIDALVELLLQQQRVSDAVEAAAPLAPHAATDFETAVLLARLHRERADAAAWQQALNTASALAGERRLPLALTAPLIGRAGSDLGRGRVVANRAQ